MRPVRMLAAGLLAAVMLGAPNDARALTVVNNPLAGGPDAAWKPLGETDSTTYGQTFVTPNATDVALQSFSFWLQSTQQNGPGPSILKPYVAEWSGTGITGPILFSGAQFSGTYANFTEIVVNTGGLVLDPAKQYVAFFSAAGLFDGVGDSVNVGTNNLSDSYPGGGFAWDNGTGVFPGANWNGCQGTCPDLAFNFIFDAATTVPEPATLALLGAGLAGLAAARRRKAA